VRSSGSYLSQSDLRLHFGLGAHRRADKVEVYWPSGGSQVLTGLDVDRFYCVKEGAGVVPCAEIRPPATRTAK
jgi:enediyne biosynthesis protein E4